MTADPVVRWGCPVSVKKNFAGWLIHMIRLDNVTKIYKGETHAVDGVTLNIEKGEFVFLVGESG